MNSASMNCCIMASFIVMVLGLYGGIMCARQWHALDKASENMVSANCTLQTCAPVGTIECLLSNGRDGICTLYNLSFTLVVDQITYYNSSIVSYPPTTEVCNNGNLVISSRATCYYDPDNIAQTVTLIHPNIARTQMIVATLFFFVIMLMPFIVCGCWACCLWCDKKPIVYSPVNIL